MNRKSAISLMLVLAMPAWAPAALAGCVDGVMRDTTAAERAAWDHVKEVVPGLFHPSADYRLDRSEVTVSRDRRCATGEHDPLFLPVHLRFVLQGQALAEANQKALRLQDRQQQVMQKHMARTMPLQTELAAHLQRFPPSPEDQEAADRIRQRMDAVVAEQERELAPLKRQSDQLQARREITVDVDINTSRDESRGLSGKAGSHSGRGGGLPGGFRGWERHPEGADGCVEQGRGWLAGRV
jgi:hypothetical protein